MNVPSFAFLGFTLVAAGALAVVRGAYARRVVLVVANLAFLLTFAPTPADLAPFAGLLVLGYSCLACAQRHGRRPPLWPLVVALLLPFCVLKRYAFVPPALTLHATYVTVGMSYVFFRIMHLIVDARQDALRERMSVLSYVSYTLNFTSLVSGPIQLYPDYRRTESEAPLGIDAAGVAFAAERIIVGFFKVLVISPLLAAAHGWSIAALLGAVPSVERVGLAALVVGIFPLALYANFSGYTDFVIGCARLLGLRLPENFDRPFTSTGFIEFWSRWHMTLSNWLKTYVYSPLVLGLMRRFPDRSLAPPFGVLAFFVTFFLVGAWHGSTAMFLVFGVLQGAGVAGNKVYQMFMVARLGRKRYAALCRHPSYAAVSRAVTFAYFAFTLLWFWATPNELAVIASRVGAATALAVLVLVAAVAVPLLTLATIAPEVGARVGTRGPYVRLGWCTALATVVVSVAVVLQAPAAQIIYKGF